MDQRALQFLQKEHIGVISVVLPDGAPHGAVVHFSEAVDPLKIFIQTFPSVKVTAIQEQGGMTKAAMVVGLSEEKFVTLQMRGEVRIVSNSEEQEGIFKIHYAKHPGAEKRRNPKTVLLEFTPTWWRYTDMKASPRVILDSEQKS